MSAGLTFMFWFLRFTSAADRICVAPPSPYMSSVRPTRLSNAFSTYSIIFQMSPLISGCWRNATSSVMAPCEASSSMKVRSFPSSRVVLISSPRDFRIAMKSRHDVRTLPIVKLATQFRNFSSPMPALRWAMGHGPFFFSWKSRTATGQRSSYQNGVGHANRVKTFWGSVAKLGSL